MSERLTVIQCKRCGRGFLLTPTHRDWLARRGVRVVQPVLCPTCFTKAGPLPKRHGTVKWFDLRRHYGFIVAEEGQEVYFRQRQIVRGRAEDARKGREVRFHLDLDQKGLQALNVELVGE